MVHNRRMGVAIGIDLGTTNTVVSAVVDGVAVTLEDEQKRRLIPSVVSFHPNGTVLVGDAARERRLVDPDNTIYSVKPILGCPFASEEVQQLVPRLPFQLAEGTQQQTMVVARGISYALAEISAFVLRRAKAVAEHALGTTVDRAVITVPANFNDLQRAATKIAGRLAGLEVMRILNEPTAAALAYGQAIAHAEKIAVFDLGGGTFDVTLLDLAGNVFEVIATAGDTALGGDDVDTALAAYLAEQVIRAHNVDPRTNAAAFARLRFAAEDVKKELTRATEAKAELQDVGLDANAMPIRMSVPITRQVFEDVVAPLVDRTVQVTRQTLDAVALSPKDFQRVLLVGGSTRMPIIHRRVRELFGKPPHMRVNPDEVVALGAAIQANALSRTKAGAKKRSAAGALGASADGGKVRGDSVASRPPTANPDELTMPQVPPAPKAPAAPPPVPGGFSLPRAAATISFGALQAQSDTAISPAPAPHAGKPSAPRSPTLTGRPDPRREPDAPDERTMAEAPKRPEQFIEPHGIVPAPRSDDDVPRPRPARRAVADAAPPTLPPPGEESFPIEIDITPNVAPPTAADVEAGHAVPARADAPLLIDVTPLSLRVETVGGFSDVLIHANASVPCEQTRSFFTGSDGQTTVRIRVAQGEAPRFAENAYLGELELTGLPPAARGTVKVAVTFELDADGILNVRARDTVTGRETAATMRLTGAESDDAALHEMAARQRNQRVVSG